jgi:hypothetical protein
MRPHVGVNRFCGLHRTRTLMIISYKLGSAYDLRATGTSRPLKIVGGCSSRYDMMGVRPRCLGVRVCRGVYGDVLDPAEQVKVVGESNRKPTSNIPRTQYSVGIWLKYSGECYYVWPRLSET